MKLVFPHKAVPKWAIFGLIPVLLLLAVAIAATVSSLFLSYNKPATLSIVSGNVQVSDGMTDLEAGNGTIITRNVRTLLKTGKGIANLILWDGSYVVIDSASTVEINRQVDQDPGMTFAFNLVEGKVLLINGKESLAPTQLFIGGNLAIRIFQAAIGLEVSNDGNILKRIDCLVGRCLVNGIYLLSSGQYAQMGPDSAIQINAGVPYKDWISLGIASKPDSELTNLLVSILPTAIPTFASPPLSSDIEFAIPTADQSLLTPSPSHTLTLSPTPEPSPTKTTTSSPTISPSPTYIYWYQTPTPTPTIWLMWIPTRTSTPTPSRIPSITPSPTQTWSPIPTFTFTPLPTFTFTPTFTPLPTDTPTQTLTPSDVPTLTPTKTRKHSSTSTIEPSATNTDTLTPTDTPLPTNTPIPTDTPIPPDTPTPTDTPIPPVPPTPTDTPIPAAV